MDSTEAAKKSFLETFNKAKSKQLNELRKENEYCDLTLKCEDGFEIKVHRNIVLSASNYFKDLLTLPMKEKFQESISMPDITGDVLEKIITFIYTSEFEEEIKDVEKIIKYAVIFQLQELVEICSLALGESITDHSCLKYWRFAKNNLIYSLEVKCLSYIAIKADHLFESSLMPDLTIEEMRLLLADDRLHLHCAEKKIFEHVWKWTESKVSETKSFSQVFSEVIDLLHIFKLENEFVFQKMFDNEDILVNAELLKKVAKLTKQKDENEVPSRLIFHKPTKHRLFGLAPNKMLIGLGEECTIEKEFGLRSGFGYTTFDNKLLISGGKRCEFFVPSTQKWKNFPPMKTQRWWHECSYLDNKIYACGGDEVDSKTVEIFDLCQGEWNYGPEMFQNKSKFGLTVVNRTLYAIGGQNSDYIENFDPRTQKWSIIYSTFRTPYQRVQCVSIGPSIYCFTYEKRYIFDTRSNRFTEEIRCKDFTDYFNLCELSGYIYGFGYQKESADKYSLNLIQYNLDETKGFKKSYGNYNSTECYSSAIVSLYY